MDRSEILWRQYQQNIELFKFYLDQLIKLETFYYAITGAIFSYYFANKGVEGAEYSLLLPLFISVFLGIFFFYGASLLPVIRQEIFDIRDQLNLQVAPDVNVLAVLLIIFGSLSFLIAIVCGIFIWCV